MSPPSPEQGTASSPVTANAPTRFLPLSKLMKWAITFLRPRPLLQLHHGRQRSFRRHRQSQPVHPPPPPYKSPPHFSGRHPLYCGGFICTPFVAPSQPGSGSSFTFAPRTPLSARTTSGNHHHDAPLTFSSARHPTQPPRPSLPPLVVLPRISHNNQRPAAPRGAYVSRAAICASDKHSCPATITAAYFPIRSICSSNNKSHGTLY